MSDHHDRRFAALVGETEGYLREADIGGGLGSVKRGLKRSSRTLGRGAKLAARAHPLAVTAVAAKYASKGLAAATGPLRRRIFRAFFGKLVGRRARALSWSRRRSLRPDAADVADARRWSLAYVKRKGVFGKLVGAALSGDVIGEPATAAALTVSIPVLLELAKRALRAAEREGAPSDPRGEAGGEGQVAPGQEDPEEG